MIYDMYLNNMAIAHKSETKQSYDRINLYKYVQSFPLTIGRHKIPRLKQSANIARKTLLRMLLGVRSLLPLFTLV